MATKMTAKMVEKNNAPMMGDGLTLADEQHLAACLSLSKRHLGMTAGNPSVAAVLATPTKIIDAAITAIGGRPHAEEILLARNPAIPLDATLYLSLEPCAHSSPHRANSCTDAILQSGIKRLVVACLDPNPKTHGMGIAKLKKSGLQVLLTDKEKFVEFEKKAKKIHQGFFYRMNEKQPRPLVAVKIAISANGIATPTAAQGRQITRGQLQFFAQYIRCRYDGLLVSANTVVHDDPLLTIRLRGLPALQQPRFLLDAKKILTGKEKIFATIDDQPLIIFTPNHNKNLPAAARQIILPVMNGHFSWHELLARMADMNITRLLVESGGGLAMSLSKQNLLDELWLCQQHDVVLEGEAPPILPTIIEKSFTNGLPMPMMDFSFDNQAGSAKKYDCQ